MQWASLIAVILIAAPSICRADSSDLVRIEKLTSMPEDIAELEAFTKDKPTDSTEIRILRKNLRDSFGSYKGMLESLRAKYGAWIDSEKAAKRIREELDLAEKKSLPKILAIYLQLGLAEVKAFYHAPKGSKGQLSEMIDDQRIQGFEMILQNGAGEIQKRELIQQIESTSGSNSSQ